MLSFAIPKQRNQPLTPASACWASPRIFFFLLSFFVQFFSGVGLGLKNGWISRIGDGSSGVLESRWASVGDMETSNMLPSEQGSKHT